jgi:hypothetical protein
MEASARRIISWLQNPEEAVDPEDLRAILPMDGVTTPPDFNTLPFEVDQDVQQLLNVGSKNHYFQELSTDMQMHFAYRLAIASCRNSF